MYRSGGIYSARDKGMEPQYFSTRLTTADFFAMFDVPFLYGGPGMPRPTPAPNR